MSGLGRKQRRSAFYTGCGFVLLFFPARKLFLAPNRRLSRAETSLPILCEKRSPIFHFIISKLPFNTKHRRSVESVFKFHPNACVVLHIDKSLDAHSVEERLARFRNQQFSIWLHTYTVTSALRTLEKHGGRDLSSKAQTFSKSLSAYTDGPYWYSHVTDFLRLFLLYTYGGWYLDTDVVVLRPLDGLEDVIGRQAPDEVTEQNATVLYLNGSGSVMHFCKNSSFVKWALMEFLSAYKAHVWGANGPELLSDLVSRIRDCKENFQNCHVKVLPVQAFQPVHFVNMTNALKSPKMSFKDDNYVFHYNNKIVHDVLETQMSNNSLAIQLFNDYCVFCEEYVS